MSAPIILHGLDGHPFEIMPTDQTAAYAAFDTRALRALRGTATGESMAGWGINYLRHARAMLTLTQPQGQLWSRLAES